jgi:hypothetical protein
MLPDSIESAAWLARRPDIAVARAELKPMFMTRLELHHTNQTNQRSTFSKS